MQQVAEHLCNHAINLKNSGQYDLFDLFGRSSLNRFYYTMFLLTRDLIKELSPGTEKAQHKQFPGVLRDTIPDQARKRSRKISSHLVSEEEKQRTLSRLHTELRRLADLLETANRARVAADYRPDEKLSIDDMTLDGISIENAKQWPNRVILVISRIRKAWYGLGL